MALLIGFTTKEYTDAETGCHTHDEAALQSCREAYFLKQQNQITKNQQSEITVSKDDNTATQAQIDTLKSELNTLKAQQNPNQAPTSTPQEIILSGNMLAVLFVVFAVTIIPTVIITKRIVRK